MYKRTKKSQAVSSANFQMHEEGHLGSRPASAGRGDDSSHMTDLRRKQEPPSGAQLMLLMSGRMVLVLSHQSRGCFVIQQKLTHAVLCDFPLQIYFIKPTEGSELFFSIFLYSAYVGFWQQTFLFMPSHCSNGEISQEGNCNVQI